MAKFIELTSPNKCTKKLMINVNLVTSVAVMQYGGDDDEPIQTVLKCVGNKDAWSVSESFEEVKKLIEQSLEN